MHPDLCRTNNHWTTRVVVVAYYESPFWNIEVCGEWVETNDNFTGETCPPRPTAAHILLLGSYWVVKEVKELSRNYPNVQYNNNEQRTIQELSNYPM